MCDYSFWVFFPPCATLLETKIAHISEIFLSVRLLETENRTAMESLCKKKKYFFVGFDPFSFFFCFIVVVVVVVVNLILSVHIAHHSLQLVNNTEFSIRAP